MKLGSVYIAAKYQTGNSLIVHRVAADISLIRFRPIRMHKVNVVPILYVRTQSTVMSYCQIIPTHMGTF